jgi:hypothetical protein
MKIAILMQHTLYLFILIFQNLSTPIQEQPLLHLFHPCNEVLAAMHDLARIVIKWVKMAHLTSAKHWMMSSILFSRASGDIK